MLFDISVNNVGGLPLTDPPQALKEKWPAVLQRILGVFMNRTDARAQQLFIWHRNTPKKKLPNISTFTYATAAY